MRLLRFLVLGFFVTSSSIDCIFAVEIALAPLEFAVNDTEEFAEHDLVRSLLGGVDSNDVFDSTGNANFSSVDGNFTSFDNNRTADDRNSTFRYNNSLGFDLRRNASDCALGDCPCNSTNDCSENAICINDFFEPLGYRCLCKLGYMDVFYSEDRLPGRLCVKIKLRTPSDQQKSSETKMKIPKLDSFRHLAKEILEASTVIGFPLPPTFPIGEHVIEADLRLLLDDFDTDRNGYVSSREFSESNLADGVLLSKRDVDSLFVLVDQNGDQRLELSEFLRVFSPQTRTGYVL